MKSKTTIGIIDEGKDTIYNNVETEGFDIGMLNRGARTQITNSRFRIHDNLLWFKSWWWQIISGLIVVILGGYFLYLLAWN